MTIVSHVPFPTLSIYRLLSHLPVSLEAGIHPEIVTCVVGGLFHPPVY